MHENDVFSQKKRHNFRDQSGHKSNPLKLKIVNQTD